MTEVKLDPLASRDVTVVRARAGRSLASSELVNGSTDRAMLDDYAYWLTISVMLGDTDLDLANASLGRAEQVFVANCSKVHRL